MRKLSADVTLFTTHMKVTAVVNYDLNEGGDIAAISVLGIALLVGRDFPGRVGGADDRRRPRARSLPGLR